MVIATVSRMNRRKLLRGMYLTVFLSCNLHDKKSLKLSLGNSFGSKSNLRTLIGLFFC